MNDHNNNRYDDEKHQDEFELTAAEKEALKKLPKDRLPGPALEDRLVSNLQKRGLLQPSRHRVVEITAWRFAVAVAACLILLTTGFLFGQWTGSWQPPVDDTNLSSNNDLQPATSLQQAGTAYLLALERLTDLPESADNQQATQGQEIALSTLCTAADQVTRLVPKNVLMGQLLAVLETDSDARTFGGNGDIIIENNRIIQF